MSEQHRMQPVPGWGIWRCADCCTTVTSETMFRFGPLVESAGECSGGIKQPAFDRPPTKERRLG